jgi:hypothetical protein
MCVSDNGNGVSEELLINILNFDTRTSDKAAYRSSSRGTQGNALKTILGIPHALGGGKITIESWGLRHEIIASANPAGLVDIDLKTTEIERRVGATIYVDLPHREVDVFRWGRAFAIFNPHVSIKVTEFDDIEFTLNLENSDENKKTEQKITLVNSEAEIAKSGVFYKNDKLDEKVIMVNSKDEISENAVFYKKVADCSKIKPTASTSIHWYDTQAFVKLVFLKGSQDDISLREFISHFDGFTSPLKVARITMHILAQPEHLF